MASESGTTTDHGELRRWVEEHDGSPAHVRGAGGDGDLRVLRIDSRRAPARSSSSTSPGSSD